MPLHLPELMQARLEWIEPAPMELPRQPHAAITVSTYRCP